MIFFNSINNLIKNDFYLLKRVISRNNLKKMLKCLKDKIKYQNLLLYCLFHHHFDLTRYLIHPLIKYVLILILS
jgi:hypothetical protein